MTSGSTPRSRRSRWVVWLVVGLVVAVLGVYAFNVEENVRLRDRVSESCTVLLRESDRAFSSTSMSLVFGPDTTTVSRLLREQTRDTCNAVREQLAWWRWNLGTSFALSVDAGRKRRLAVLFRRARTNCPTTVRAQLRELATKLGGSPADVEPTVTRICALMPTTGTYLVPEEDLPIHAWVEMLERIARTFSGARLPGGRTETRRE